MTDLRRIFEAITGGEEPVVGEPEGEAEPED